MHTVIISGGTIIDTPAINNELNKADRIICADGGADYVLSKGLVPNDLLGDMDSISKETIDTIKSMKQSSISYHSTEKDNTDTQLAVLKAIEIGSSEITLIGGTGTRMDHSLSNIFLLEYIYDKGVKSKIIDANNYIFLIKKQFCIEKLDGYKISLIPLSDRVIGITTKGLEYSLENGILERNMCIGISNEFIADKAEINIKDGTLLLILAKD